MEFVDIVVYYDLYGGIEATNLGNLLKDRPNEQRVAHFKGEDFSSLEECATLLRDLFLPEDGSISVYTSV